MPTKVLFLGLDAADPDLIEQWAGEGRLPNFRNLFATSAYGRTLNPPGLYVGAVWPSFSTSVTPARHARYCFSQLESGTYDSKSFRPEDQRAPPFWEALGDQGAKLAVIDVPKAGIANGGFTGLQIADWGTHDPEYPEARTWPPGLAESLRSEFGADPIHNCNGERLTAADFGRFRDTLIDRAKRKSELITHVLDSDHWDCVLATFSESHCVGHQCWHVHDSTHPRHDPAVAADCGDPMLAVYEALDTQLGALLSGLGPDTLTLILASHGMGPHYEAGYLLEPILEGIERSRYGAGTGPTGVRGLKRLWKTLPPGIRKRFQPARRAAKCSGLTPLASKRFFKIPNNDVFGGIRINLLGREPRGRVEPGTEFDAVCGALIDDLQTLTNVETGRPLVTNVLRTADIYQGECLDDLPDLMVEWDRTAPIRQIRSPLFGTISGEYTGCRSGDHKAEGLFFAAGEEVRPGRVGESVSVMDFGPTIARALGQSLHGVDGRPIGVLSPGS